MQKEISTTTLISRLEDMKKYIESLVDGSFSTICWEYDVKTLEHTINKLKEIE